MKETTEDTRVEEVALFRRAKFKLSMSMNEECIVSRSTLRDKYDIKRYDLHPDYSFVNFADMIPRGTPEFIDSGQRYVERIIRALYYFKQCSLIGPSGTGKTHVVYLVAELCGLPVFEVNCGLQTSCDLIGCFTSPGEEDWVDGLLTRWLRQGGIMYLDEANMMKQDMAARLNTILDTGGQLVLKEKHNELIERHRFGYLIISMNPYSTEFAGTKSLNATMRRRVKVWINFDYASVGEQISQEEVKMLKKLTKLNEDVAYKIVQVGAKLRRHFKTGGLPCGPSFGDLVNWANLVRDGNTVHAAADETIVPVTSDNVEVQDHVRRIIVSVFPKPLGKEVSTYTGNH